MKPHLNDLLWAEASVVVAGCLKIQYTHIHGLLPFVVRVVFHVAAGKKRKTTEPHRLLVAYLNHFPRFQVSWNRRMKARTDEGNKQARTKFNEH